MKAVFRFIRWLRLTRQETTALVAVFGLYVVGMTWKHVQESRVKYDQAYYARIDSATGVGALRPVSYPLAAALDTVPKPKTSDSTAADSEAVEAVDMKTGRLNINLATERQFTMLPRIGPALARRIVEYRETAGPFKSTSDLLNVKGIGAKTLQGFEGMIVVE